MHEGHQEHTPVAGNQHARLPTCLRNQFNPGLGDLVAQPNPDIGVSDGSLSSGATACHLWKQQVDAHPVNPYPEALSRLVHTLLNTS